MYCKKCGNELRPNDKFCRKCGAVATPLVDIAPVQHVQSVENDVQAAMDYLDEMFANLGLGTAATKPARVKVSAAGENKTAEGDAETKPEKSQRDATITAKEKTDTETDVAEIATDEVDAVPADNTDDTVGTDDPGVDTDAQAAPKAGPQASPKKTSPLKIILALIIIAAITAIATGIFLWRWPKMLRDDEAKQNAQNAQSGGTTNAPVASGASGAANPLDSIYSDQDIMDASIAAYTPHGPNIREIDTLYDLKFTEDREYNLEGLNRAILFDDDLWYMNDLMENIHYTPEIVRTLIEYFSMLTEKKNTGDDSVLTYINADSDLYKEIEAIQPEPRKNSGNSGGSNSEYVQHVIEKMQIGEMRRSGENFYILLRLIESTDDGAPETDTVQAVHLFARPKVLEVREMNVPTGAPYEWPDEDADETTDAEESTDDQTAEQTDDQTVDQTDDQTDADESADADQTDEEKDE